MAKTTSGNAPMRNMELELIIKMLEAPVDLALIKQHLEETGTIHPSHKFSVKLEIKKNASVKNLIEAVELVQSNSARCMLFEILGWRKAKSAVPLLISYLNDPALEIRNEVAEALYKIRSPKACAALLRSFAEFEAEHCVRQTIAIAFGSLECQCAIPALTLALSDSDAKVRGFSAMSLAQLGAIEAIHDISVLLDDEDSWVRDKAAWALGKLQASSSAARK